MSRLYWLVGGAAALALATWAHEHHASAAIAQAVAEAEGRASDVAAHRLAEANARTSAAETQAGIAELEGNLERKELQARARADADRAGGELGRLRAAIAAYRGRGDPPGQGTGAGGRPDEGSLVADALGQCSERYAGVAAVADQLSVQVTGLQRYITRVVGPLCIAGFEEEAAGSRERVEH